MGIDDYFFLCHSHGGSALEHPKTSRVPVLDLLLFLDGALFSMPTLPLHTARIDYRHLLHGHPWC